MRGNDEEKKDEILYVRFMGSSDKKVAYMSCLHGQKHGFIDNDDTEFFILKYSNNYYVTLSYVPFDRLSDNNSYSAHCLIICPTTENEITRIYNQNLTTQAQEEADIYVVLDSSSIEPPVLKAIEDEAFSLGLEVKQPPNAENRTNFLNDLIKTSKLSVTERKTIHQDNINEYKEFKQGPARRAHISEFFKDTHRDEIQIMNDYVGGENENKIDADKTKESNTKNTKP